MTTPEVMPFAAAHLEGVLRLCTAEGWDSLPSNPERALRVLTAPGVTTYVAVDDEAVVGFAQMFSDGEIQAFLTSIAVDTTCRGAGIGKALVVAALRATGAERIDLLSEPASTGFYAKFPHFVMPGYRLYPFYRGGEHAAD